MFRTFDGAAPPPQPDRARREALARAFPDAVLLGFPRAGAALRRDYKWLGSHRYGVLHLGGEDERALRERYRAACSLIGWPESW